MAVYTVEADEVGVHNKALTANVVDAVNFESDPVEVEILSDGSAAIYVTVDGSEPTVGGQNTYKLPDAECVRTLPHNGNPRPVKLISAGTPTYSVTRAA